MTEHITALQLYLVDALEIDRRSLTRYGVSHTGVMHLQAADFGFDPFRIDLDPIFAPDHPREQRPSDHGAKAANREDAIDGEAKFPLQLFRRHAGDECLQ